MTQTLESFLNGAKNKEFAIHTGTEIHAALQQISTTYQRASNTLSVVKA